MKAVGVAIQVRLGHVDVFGVTTELTWVEASAGEEGGR